MTGAAPAHRGRRDNGLVSDRFAPVADVDPRLSDHLLDVLGLSEVAAYVEPGPAVSRGITDRLFVAADRTDQGRQVLSAIASELGIEIAEHHSGTEPSLRRDPLSGIDTDAEFAAIVSGLGDLGRPLVDLDLSAAEPSDRPADTGASYGRRRTDARHEVDHFVPPPPPPLPRLSAATAAAVVVTLLGVVVLAFGSVMGLPADLPLPAGVVLILFGAVMLVLRLRPEPRDDSDDDGAVL